MKHFERNGPHHPRPEARDPVIQAPALRAQSSEPMRRLYRYIDLISLQVLDSIAVRHVFAPPGVG